jgi:hypothetical protein
MPAGGGRDPDKRRANPSLGDRRAYASGAMTTDDLFALTKRLLDRLNLNYAVGDDGASLLTDSDDGVPISISFAEVADSTESTWPVVCLALPLLTAVDMAAASERLGDLNEELVIGKVSARELDGEPTLWLEHETVGWPGAAEYQVTLEVLVGNAVDLRARLSSEISGTKPVLYADLVDG